MKTLFHSKTLIAMAVAIAAAAGAVSQAQEQPMPPLAGDSALPAAIVPGSPLAEVIKLVRAGVDADTIKGYIVNSQSAFNLDADKILFLKDEGVSSDLVNAMLERDKILYGANIATAPAPAPASGATTAEDTAPPATEVDVNYFNNTLSAYGSWVEVDGYGRCWRPTAVVYDSTWRPYCDRGHWVYTDYGWYWDSDYSWGVTFHYGRWFHQDRFGWCWYPDTQWAPSWVTWRSGGDYCGWAPLPPFAVFRPGVGFFYRGASVAVDFDFGLGADRFTFISSGHFAERHPRYFRVEPQRAMQIFHQTTVINNFNVNNRTIINRGIPVEHITGVTHRQLEPVHIGSLPNAGRQGWRGEGFNQPALHTTGNNNNNPGRNFSNGNDPLRHGPEFLNNPKADANGGRSQNFGQPVPSPNPGGNQFSPAHPSLSESPGNRNYNPSAQQKVNLPANNGSAGGYQNQRRTDPPVMNNNHFQTSTLPPPEHREVQNNRPAGENNPIQSQNILREQTQPQIRQYNPPATIGGGGAQNDWHQTRSVETPAVGVPGQHAAPQPETRQFAPPSVPSAPVVPRSYTPPQQPAPATVPSQPRNVSNVSGQNPDKDRQNH
jgi:hypothetical protein